MLSTDQMLARARAIQKDDTLETTTVMAAASPATGIKSLDIPVYPHTDVTRYACIEANHLACDCLSSQTVTISKEGSRVHELGPCREMRCFQ